MTERGAAPPHSSYGSATVIRSIALALVVVWAAASVGAGGWRRSLVDAWTGLHTRGQVAPGQPDARMQWSGLYYNALDAVVHSPLGPETTIAVALTETRIPTLTGPSAAWMYEAIYRLYPIRPDFYVRSPSGDDRSFWFASPDRPAPTTPALWQHSYVLWTDLSRVPAASGHRLIYANSEAQVYQAESR